VLLSEEGTTQGDPLAKPFCALATIPLLGHLLSGVVQVWYADDTCAGGKLCALRKWWDHLYELGPPFGYFVNPVKWLITKHHVQQDAGTGFADSGIRITSEGRPYLGAAIGSENFVNSFVADKVKGWVEEVTQLARFAESQPHAAYGAFTHDLSSHWLFVSQTVPSESDYFQPLENVIRQVFIPALTGCSPPNGVKAFVCSPCSIGIFTPPSGCSSASQCLLVAAFSATMYVFFLLSSPERLLSARQRYRIIPTISLSYISS